MRRLLQGGEIVRRAHITQRHADIAEESAPFGPQDGRVAEEVLELPVVEREEFTQGLGQQVGARLQGGIARSPGEAVPRAGIKAVVTAENTVAHRLAEFLGNGPLVLDGEEGDTAAGIELIRRGDCLRRTSLNAAGAASAAVGQGGIGREFEGGENDREKKPGPQLRMDPHRALAMPGHAAGCGPVAFEDRSTVDEAPLSPSSLCEVCGEGFEARGDHLVVIVAPGVAGDAASPACRGAVAEIIRGQDNDRLGPGEDSPRIAAVLLGAPHPFHAGLPSVVQPRAQRLGMRCRSGLRESAEVESQLLRHGADFVLGHDRRSRT